jgi:hypothetical protein
MFRSFHSYSFVSLSLWPTQPPIRWVSGAVFLGVKRLGREADHSLPPTVEVKEFVKLYLHSPNMSSKSGAHLSTGTTLPSPLHLIIFCEEHELQNLTFLSRIVVFFTLKHLQYIIRSSE